MQPARVRQIDGTPGHFACAGEMKSESAQVWQARVVIDAHGSWEHPLILRERGASLPTARMPALDSDLYALKETFTDSMHAPGLWPVMAFPGGYGGVVLGTDEEGSSTVESKTPGSPTSSW